MGFKRHRTRINRNSRTIRNQLVGSKLRDSYFYRRNVRREIGKVHYEDDVDTLVRKLEDERLPVRVAAAKTLGKVGWNPSTVEEKVSYLIACGNWKNLPDLGTRAIPFLLDRLFDYDRFTRLAMTETLGKLKNPCSVQPLIEKLTDGARCVRNAAVKALGNIDAPAIKPLVNALESNNSDLRAGAAKALGLIDHPATIKPLIETLEDEEPLVKKEAVSSLGNKGSARVVKLLIRALRDANDEVRKEAEKSLVKIGQPAIKEMIAFIVREGNGFDEQQFCSALNLLIRLSPLKEQLKVLEPLLVVCILGDSNEKIAKAAKELLKRIFMANFS
ncbi:MAG: HEAT repeat domain-containing protein [Candidatus Odinarchaeota archaeon]